MGLYPFYPGRAELLIASPLFPHLEVRRANGTTIVVTAPDATPAAPYVQSLRVDGRETTRPWLPEAFVSDGGTLEFHLTATPNPTWGSLPADAPPSFGKPGGI